MIRAMLTSAHKARLRDLVREDLRQKAHQRQAAAVVFSTAHPDVSRLTDEIRQGVEILRELGSQDPRGVAA